MRVRKYSLVLLIIISCAQSMSAQQSQSLMSSVDTYYKSLNKMDLKINFTMFKGSDSNEITENYSGTFHREVDVSQLKILNSEVLQFSEVQLILDHENKIVIYNKVSPTDLKNSPLNLNDINKHYKETSQETIGNRIVIIMMLKNKISQLPYNKILLHINKSSYAIEKQELFFSKKLPFVDKNGKQTYDFGKLVIDVESSQNSTIETPELKDYVLINTNEQVQLTKKYTNYTLNYN